MSLGRAGAPGVVDICGALPKARIWSEARPLYDIPTPRVAFFAVAISTVSCCFTISASAQQRPQPDAVATAMIGSGGGTVELLGGAVVTFPPGAFAVPQPVTVRTTNVPETDQGRASLDVGGAGLGPFLPYDVRLEAPLLPSTGIDVALQLPRAFLDALPKDCHPRAFIWRVGGGAGEELTVYEDVGAVLDSVSNVFRFTISEPWDPYGRGMFEQIVVVAGPEFKCAA